MADENTAPSIDSTPLSPIERQESLEKHLQMRPDAQDLKNRNILRDTNAAPYARPLSIAYCTCISAFRDVSAMLTRDGSEQGPTIRAVGIRAPASE